MRGITVRAMPRRPHVAAVSDTGRGCERMAFRGPALLPLGAAAITPSFRVFQAGLQQARNGRLAVLGCIPGPSDDSAAERPAIAG